MSETDRTPKRVGIVGLGLIGGSFAKAYADAGIEVFAADIDERAMNAAMAEETVVAPLDEASIPSCDLLIMRCIPRRLSSGCARMSNSFRLQRSLSTAEV